MVPANSTGVSPAPAYSGYQTEIILYGTWLSHAMAGFSMPFPPSNQSLYWPYNPASALTGAVWTPPCSLATTYGITIVFYSSGYLDVSVPRVGSLVPWLHHGGLPHSETMGSKAACASPMIIVACHVLHRLQKPRHPLCALIAFLNHRLSPIADFIRVLQSVKELSPPVPIVLGQCGMEYPWWRISESNRWPPACKAGALAS
jgi:hypothetical protein